jgi:arginase
MRPFAGRHIELIGVPSSAGSLYNGTEGAPAAYRAAGLLELLREQGVDIEDGRDVPVPSFLPRHDIPPIRNWPAPRIVWDAVAARVASARIGGVLPFLVGADCSVVVGAVSGLVDGGATNLHVISFDAHVDAVAPIPERCVGAAAVGLRLLTTQSPPFWHGPLLEPTSVCVIGCRDLQGLELPFRLVELAEVRAAPRVAAAAVLEGIPAGAPVLIHFDVDVIDAAEMPAAYAPNHDGLSGSAVAEVLSVLLADERVAAIEVPELTVQRDLSGDSARLIVDLFRRALSER